MAGVARSLWQPDVAEPAANAFWRTSIASDVAIDLGGFVAKIFSIRSIC